MTTKKELKREIKELKQLNEKGNQTLSEIVDERDFYRNQTQRYKDHYEDWRKKYELLLHTPEYKADTEAAFNRGFEHGKRQLKSYVLGIAQMLDTQTPEETDESRSS